MRTQTIVELETLLAELRQIEQEEVGINDPYEG